MIVSLSGTPGTGKTSIAEHFDPQEFKIVSMNALTKNYNTGVDEGRGSAEVDIEAMVRDISEGKISLPEETGKHTIIEGHLSHHLITDTIIILRTSTMELERRLRKRSYSNEKIRENMEAEAMGVISLEALETECPMYEIDMTNVSPEEGAAICRRIILNPPAPLTEPAELIDYTGEILEWY